MGRHRLRSSSMEPSEKKQKRFGSFTTLNAMHDSTVNQNDVALSFAKHVISTTEAKHQNFVFSPLSIHVVMGLVASGSGGPSRDQLLAYFESGSIKELTSLNSKIVNLMLVDGGPYGGPHLSSAIGVLVDEGLTLKPAFKQVVESDYKAACKHVDFKNKADEVEKEVNAWAEQETNGLIKHVIPSGAVDSDTKLILANALYFKGDWTDEFDADLTKRHKFFLLNGSSVQVPFLTSYENQFITAFDDFKVTSLTYKQGGDERQFSMSFFLPDSKDGLSALVEKLYSESRFIDHHLPSEIVEVGDFRIPKFKINFDFEASEVLKGQGLVLPFIGGGLTEMVDSDDPKDNLEVSKIFHNSFIEVNEEGTKAVASTTAFSTAGTCSMFRQKRKKLDFVADHPFIFVIREDMSGVLLFVGQVLNPLAG